MTERRAILIPLLGWVLLAGVLLASALWSPTSHAEVMDVADAVASATASSTATNTPVAIVDVSVDPEISTSYIGEIFALTISVSAGSQEVDAIDARLFFSPTEMLIIGVDNGPTLNNVLNKTVNNMSGYVRYSAGRAFSDPPPSGDFMLCRLWFQSVAPSTSADLIFDTVETDVVFGGESVLRDLYNGVVFIADATATPTNTLIPSPTRTPTITNTPTATLSPTITDTPTATGTATHTGTPTNTPTITRTPTITHTPSVTGTPTNTDTVTPTSTSTATSVPTATLSPTTTATGSKTPTPTSTSTIDATATGTPTSTLTPTSTSTSTGTSTPTSSSTPPDTSTPTHTVTATNTATPTSTTTATGTSTHTPTVTQTATDTAWPTITPTPTRTPTATWMYSPTPTKTPFPTSTPTATRTPGPLVPTTGWVNFYGTIRLQNGNPAPYGTVIDAYTSAGFRCGTFMVTVAGAYGPMPVYQDDPTTPERDGARANEVIHFVINGLPAVALGPDDPVWTFNGDIWEVDLIASQNTQHVLTLKTGWNLISFNVAPANGEVLAVLHNIIGAFDRVLTFDCDEGGLSFYPWLPAFMNNLQTMDAWHGYWIEVNQNVTLAVPGVRMPAETPIELCAGYNLVGYFPDTAMPVADALASIDGLYASVLGFDPETGAQSFYPDLPAPLNSLKQMQPGRGYWIRMNEAGTLIYPAP